MEIKIKINRFEIFSSKDSTVRPNVEWQYRIVSLTIVENCVENRFRKHSKRWCKLRGNGTAKKRNMPPNENRLKNVHTHIRTHLPLNYYGHSKFLACSNFLKTHDVRNVFADKLYTKTIDKMNGIFVDCTPKCIKYWPNAKETNNKHRLDDAMALNGLG